MVGLDLIPVISHVFTVPTLGLMVGGCVVGLLFVVFLVVLIRKWRRPKKNFFDLDFEELGDCDVSRSAPISR